MLLCRVFLTFVSKYAKKEKIKVIFRDVLTAAVSVMFFLPRKDREKLKYFFTRKPKSALMRYGIPSEYKGHEKQLCRAMRQALFKYGLCYEEYMLYGLYSDGGKSAHNFVSEIGRYKYFERYNDVTEASLFRNKCALYRRFKDYYGRKCVCCEKSSDVDVFCNFVKTHESFILKPSSESCGSGIKIYSSSDIENLKEMFFKWLKQGKFICEELVLQSELFSRLNPTSLNTVRFVNNPTDRNVQAFTPFLRVGRYGKEVDNAGAGGIFASVDAKTGRVIGCGRDENGCFYKQHPDSHIYFDGLMLPEWDKAVRLVERLEENIKSRLISWDLAYSENNGWIMIEANYAGQFVCQQTCLAEKIRKVSGKET